jgi:hypothetical protein
MSLEHSPARQGLASTKAFEALPDDDQVLTIREWRALNKLSARTATRILASDHGPEVLQLSPRRLGVTRRANRAWQASRVRP